MADKRITQLNEVTRATGSDVFALVNEAETRKITYANLTSSLNSDIVAANTGSFMLTGSMDYASGSIDFTKGDGSTFELILPQGQGAPAANSYLVATVISGSANQEVALTGSIYENTAMIQLHYDGANGTCILWLPDATTPTNKCRSIRFISNGSVSANDKFAISGSNNQTIDGNIDPYFIDRDYEGIMLWSDGTEWFRIQSKA